VLDPFAGTGTVLEVALQHNRSGIGIELSEDYIELARQRINRTPVQEVELDDGTVTVQQIPMFPMAL
jgi:DNA modification methylase